MAATPDNLETGKMFVIGFAGIVFTYISVLLLQGLYYRGEGQEWQRKVVERPVEASDAVLAEQMLQLRSYGVVDAEAGTYQIPVERAMENVAAQLGN